MPVARHHLNSTYCAPYGYANTYRPMFTPPAVGFLRPPRRFPAFTNVTTRVPVLRTEDDLSIRFYYHGEGCSDTYIRVNTSNGLVAHDRLDAVRRMSNANTAKAMGDRCAHAIELAAMQILPRTLTTRSPAYNDLKAIRSYVSGSGCLNELIHQLMRNKGIDTLVLNFEAPGASVDPTLTSRKTEIIYLGTDFYDANDAKCTLHNHHGCYFCANSTTTRKTCMGRLSRNAVAPPASPLAPPQTAPLLPWFWLHVGVTK